MAGGGSGRFITVEGGEGAGKSTQASLLADHLAAAGLPVLRTREPGGAPGAEALRALLLAPGRRWSLPAETLLHFAARAEHIEATLRPALAAGLWVVCDRFTDSTLAYQGYGQGGDHAAIRTLIALAGLAPDLTLMLDIAEETARRRLAARGGTKDRYEALPPDFHARVRSGFLAIAAAEPARCVVLDAAAGTGAVQQAVRAAVRQRLGAPP